MKKWKICLMALITIVYALAKCTVAEAAENEVDVVQVGRTVEILSDVEMTEVSQEIIGGNNGEQMSSNATYTAYRYTDSFEFSLNGLQVARVDAECIVWHYTDGKVHLYSRTISITRVPQYDAARVYGSIVNTDGSYSYTTGDRVYLFLDQGTWVYAIDFYVSNTDAYFSCYEV